MLQIIRLLRMHCSAARCSVSAVPSLQSANKVGLQCLQCCHCRAALMLCGEQSMPRNSKSEDRGGLITGWWMDVQWKDEQAEVIHLCFCYNRSPSFFFFFLPFLSPSPSPSLFNSVSSSLPACLSPFVTQHLYSLYLPCLKKAKRGRGFFPNYFRILLFFVCKLHQIRFPLACSLLPEEHTAFFFFS